MQILEIRLPVLPLLIGVLLFPGITAVHAGQDVSSNPEIGGSQAKEDDVSSWAFAFDNDVLALQSQDQGYTFGLNFTYTGKYAESQWASLHKPLDWIDLKINLDGLVSPGVKSSSIEYGLFAFTPGDIDRSSAIEDDRPYASLVFVSSSRGSYHPVQQVSWQSSLTVGLLGLDLVGDFQQAIHETYDGDKAEGWDHQISSGGEPTLRYSISRQNLIFKNTSGTELKGTLQGSVGYITEASWSLSMRSGTIHTPWVSFTPELTTYGEGSVASAVSKASERYFWAGIALKWRPYNALLEGQFRDSDVTYDNDQINRGIVEFWVGYTMTLRDGYSVTYSMREHSSELKEGKGDRNVTWGGVVISKSIW